jgi:hypothetical protein
MSLPRLPRKWAAPVAPEGSPALINHTSHPEVWEEAMDSFLAVFFLAHEGEGISQGARDFLRATHRMGVPQ